MNMSVKVNVLVYSGVGTTIESVRHCIYTLRRLLSPNYAIIAIVGDTLVKEPWETTCALLCIPGGADLGTCNALNGEGNRKIIQFVRRGGTYLGFCAGGYYGSARCEFEVGKRFMEVVGSRELRFFPGTCRGAAFKGFVYDSEAGARAASINVSCGFAVDKKLPEEIKVYYNGGGVFVDAHKYTDRGVEIIAKYRETLDVDGGEGDAAVIYCKVGEGAAILTGPHPEFAPENLDKANNGPAYTQLLNDLVSNDSARIDFLTACLEKLGLKTNTGSTAIPSLSNLYLTSDNPVEIRRLVDNLQEIITTSSESETKLIVGENDTFILEEAAGEEGSTGLPGHAGHENQVNDGIIDYNKIPKHVRLYLKGYPIVHETPYFNHSLYYNCLSRLRSISSSENNRMGTPVLYGEVVTSTNTMLDKNFKLLQLLPTGFVAIGTTQIAGRGRGSNVWVSPTGVLAFSLCIRHEWRMGAVAPVVFIQYLAALATVEAIKTYGPGYSDMPVRLKWPNDLYIEDPSNSNPASTGSRANSFVKIGGILVNSSFSNNEYLLVVGCGLNTTNKAPTTSLNLVIDTVNLQRIKKNLGPLSYFQQEALLAKILVVFEEMYQIFCVRGFSPFENKYYQYWLHSGQTVQLDMEGGLKAKIKGITMEDGLLVAEELDSNSNKTGKIYTLQTDNNSFDFFRGLLKKKNA